MRSHRMRARAVAAVYVAASAAAAIPANAATRYYVGNGAAWNTPTSWSDTPGGTPGASVPITGDTAYLIAAGPLSVPYDAYGTWPGLAALYVDSSDTSPVTLSTGAFSTYLVADAEYVGSAGSGAITQSAQTNKIGTDLVLGQSLGSAGLYSLSGTGILSINNALYVGQSGAGSFLQSGGSNGVPTAYVGYAANSSGTYVLSAGSLAATTLYVGYDGAGTVSQSGGVASPATALYLGYGNGSRGVYSLSNTGTLAAAGAEYLAYAGAGSFTQCGGSHSVAGGFYLGYYAFTTATYSLSGTGSLSANTEFLGYGGHATFTQSGGAHSLSNALYIGDSSGSTGTYLLSAGSLTTPIEDVANLGTGAFVQTGGTHAVTNHLDIGRLAPGSYSLSAGSLSVANTEYLGPSATFTQTGGSNHAAFLSLSSSGAYHLSGGTLTVDQGLSLSGTLDTGAAATAPTLSATGGIVDFSTGTFTNTAPLTITGSPNSLILFPAGFDPATQLAHYDNPGVTGHAGSPVTLPAGTDITGQGSLNVHVTVAGSLSAPTPTGALDLNAGLALLPGGTASLRNLSVDDASSVTGGSLCVAGSAYVGNTAAGALSQTGGTVSLSQTITAAAGSRLYLGYAAASTGTYSLSGTGALIAATEYLGYRGAGTFTQSGGTNTLSGSLVLAYAAGSSASYTLTGGTLSAASTTLNSNGTLTYAGGSASLGALTLNGSARILLTPGHDKTLTTTTLSLASTSSLDLADNTILTTSPAPTIRSYLLNHQLFSSLADSTHALGYVPGTLVKLTLLGDANLDGTLNADDYALLDAGYATGASTWWRGDFNYDGQVNQQDYLLIDSNYLAIHPSESTALLAERDSQFGPRYVAQLTATLPEPLSLSSILYPLSSLLLKRRRSRL